MSYTGRQLDREDENAPLLGDASRPDPVRSKPVTDRSAAVHIGDPINGASVHDEPVGSGMMYFSIFSCVLGTTFGFGFGIGSLNTPATVMQDVYAEWYNASSSTHNAMSSSEMTLLWSTTVSIYCLGGMLSGCVGGNIADRFGRKRTMMAMNLLQVIAVVLMFSSMWIKSYYVIIAGRLIYGFFGGLATVICPLYLNEISPPALRGKIGTVNQLSIVIGLSIAQVIGLPQILGTEDRFYYILGFPVVTAVLHWIFLAFCPESPAWLYLFRKDPDGARQALESLRDMSMMSSVDAELSEYHKAEVEAASMSQVSLKEMFTTYRRRPLLIVAVMHCSQQLSGINAVVFYSTSIFVQAHLTHTEAQYATLSLGGIMIIITLVSLSLIERLGRRSLHLHGLGGAFIAMSLLSAFLLLEETPSLEWMSYACIFSVALFIIMFSIGPGSIPWFYTAELFDHSSSKWAISIATVVNWASNFTVGLVFPTLQSALKDYSFFPFMVLIAIFWMFLYFRAPETKGRSTLEITTMFKTMHSRASLPAGERRHYQAFTTT